MAVEQLATPAPTARGSALRERKRTRTMRTIQSEALRLFTERGYERTTIEEIADAVALSPRTFFRYFPTKEDVVLWDEYDPVSREMLEGRPAGEPVLESVCAISREILAQLQRRDRDRLLLRARLTAAVPALRARTWEQQALAAEGLATVLAARSGLAADDLGTRVIAAAISATAIIVADVWQASGGHDDIATLFDAAATALSDSFRRGA